MRSQPTRWIARANSFVAPNPTAAAYPNLYQRATVRTELRLDLLELAGFGFGCATCAMLHSWNRLLPLWRNGLTANLAKHSRLPFIAFVEGAKVGEKSFLLAQWACHARCCVDEQCCNELIVWLALPAQLPNYPQSRDCVVSTAQRSPSAVPAN